MNARIVRHLGRELHFYGIRPVYCDGRTLFIDLMTPAATNTGRPFANAIGLALVTVKEIILEGGAA